MIILPEPVPTEFRIRIVKPSQQSCWCHSPFGEPRVTQSNLAKYLYAVPNKGEGTHIVPKIPDKILDKWTKYNIAEWVGTPNTVGDFMCELQNKFFHDKPEYDPRYQNKPSIFPRSYKYELDCYESRRLRKLEDKIARESALRKAPCSCVEDRKNALLKEEMDLEDLNRWQKRPKLFEKSQTDPCARRQEFQKFGLPFRNEACNFYYVNYPTTKLPFRPKKFS